MPFLVRMLLIVAVLFNASFAFATEYFVSLQGNDTNNGLSLAQAVCSIQKGLDFLKPGDTLTIAPGEYAGSVRKENLGTDAVDTFIRAMIPGTVLLRGDIPAPVFSQVPGMRFVYVANWDGPVNAVLESDTLTILELKPNAGELEFNPGKFHYDSGNKRLYISSSDLQPPTGANAHHYRIAVAGKSGMHLEKPRRVTIAGIAATGFYGNVSSNHHFGQDTWGISLVDPIQCTIGDCVAYLNSGGICMDGGKGALIERCRAFANYSVFQPDGSNIGRYQSLGDDIIRNCVSFRGFPFGIAVYPTLDGPLTLSNNLDWGDYPLYKVRTNTPNLNFKPQVNQCIGIDTRNPDNVQNCLIFEHNADNPVPANNIKLNPNKPIDLASEFADPLNMDFRLQSRSQFRAVGASEKDRGPFEYQPNIFYLSPSGDDDRDGLSVAQAWRTLKTAVSKIKPGDTVYLQAGIYEAVASMNIPAAGNQPINFRGRGDDDVVIKGPIELANTPNLNFERIHFTGPITVNQSTSTQFRNCTFQGKPTAIVAESSPGLRVEQCLFAGFSTAAISASKSSNLFFSGNIFANVDGPAVVMDQPNAVDYSDYNSYQNAQKAWAVSGEIVSLTTPQADHDRYSRIQTPRVEVKQMVLRLSNAREFAAGGALGKGLGVYSEFKKPKLNLSGPYVHSVTDTTANIEWLASIPCAVELAWGDTPECTQTVNVRGGNWGSCSLTGLIPGKKYYSRAKTVTPYEYRNPLKAPPLSLSTAPLNFKTADSAHSPVTYYVSKTGDDSKTGLTQADAWQTINRAMIKANAGDTVLIGEGVYRETVRVRATGTQKQPLTIKAMPGQRVTLDGQSRALGEAIILAAKNHVHLDSLYFGLFGMTSSSFRIMPAYEGVIVVYKSEHVRISRCLMDGRGPDYQPPFVLANSSPDLQLKNCLIANGFSGPNICVSPDFRVENCVFLMNTIDAILIQNQPGQNATISNNIFTDNISAKLSAPLFYNGPEYLADTNWFYVRVPADQRLLCKGLTLGAYITQRANGPVNGANGYVVVGDPQFVGMNQLKIPAPTNGDPRYAVDDFMVSMHYSVPPDRLLDFPDLFATNPQAIKQHVGLEPEAFSDFHFNQRKITPR